VWYFAAYKDHYSLSCPPPFTVFRAFEKELSRSEVTKSAIRLPLDEPVPELIGEMARYRAKQNVETERKKDNQGPSGPRSDRPRAAQTR
jgi:uncharacterized protein YdhG (YjbR/CyaY superfamily)